MFNSTTIDGSKKFKNFSNSSFEIQRLSDKFCHENDLSVIEKPSEKNKDYGTWLAEKGDKKEQSQREKLRLKIDEIIEKNPENMAQFIRFMREQNYKAKRGKSIAFKAPEQQKYIRLKSLGVGYSDGEILKKIESKNGLKIPENKLQNLINIEKKILEGKGENYENWARIFNLKEAAKTLIFLQENGLADCEKLEKITEEKFNENSSLDIQIGEINSRLETIKSLQKNIGTYAKTREIYAQYKASSGLFLSVKF